MFTYLKRYIGVAINRFRPACMDDDSEVRDGVRQACSQRGPRVFTLENFSTCRQKMKYYFNVIVTNEEK